MRGCKVRKLAVLITVGALVAFLVKKLRGDPAPQFANHPTVRGGPSVDPVRQPAPAAKLAPEDPTVAASADTALVAAPADPTVPEPAVEAAPETDTQPELDLPPAVPAPDDPTVPATGGTDLVAELVDPTVPGTPAAPAATGEPTWVDPVDGGCPDGYPIKAKVKSGIFHQPGGLAYDRTNPDRCYPDAASAEADGLRAAKR